MKPSLTIVVPCYNEQECLPDTVKQLEHKLDELIKAEKISRKSFILLVDDGSKDHTWAKILELKNHFPSIKALKLSKNFGHQNALYAGLMHAKTYSDCALSIDADLQDDLDVFNEFVDQFNGGCDIVYGVRSNRDADSWFKKTMAELFYKLMQALGTHIIYNHADYRLASKKVLESLSHFNEKNLFLRGIFPLIGFKSTTVSYIRKKREKGSSKYSLKKMLSFSWNGITSFSLLPLRLVSLLGFAVFLLSIAMSLYILYETLIAKHTVPGWSSILISVYFLGSIQLLSLGVIGEYIGKTYIETKGRPRYLIESEIE